MKELTIEENQHKKIIDFVYSIPIHKVNRTEKHNSIAQDFEHTTPNERQLNLLQGYNSVYLYKGNNTYATKLYERKVNSLFINTTVYCFMHYYVERIKKRMCGLEYIFKLNSFFSLINYTEVDETDRKGLEGIIHLFIKKNQLAIEFELNALLKINYKNISSPKSIPIFNNIEIRELETYKHRVLKEYTTLRLNIIQFEIPISKVIKLPLKERNLKKEQLLRDLEAKLMNESIDSTKEILCNRIEKLKDELQMPFDIDMILNKGGHIFIQAPAGSGKTTLLQWMAYKFALSIDGLKESTIPVFISLKQYSNTSDKKSFKSFVAKNMKELSFEELIMKGTHLTLLIDGFDEYEGDRDTLLNELSLFNTIIPVQFIVSGRAILAYEHTNLIFDIYTLTSFSDADILQLAIYILDKNRAEKIINQLIILGLSDQFRVPLFLILLLSHIKGLGEELDDSIVYNLAHNKSALFEKTLIKNFLLNYEKKRAKSPQYWEIKKERQIEIITYIAYYLTFILGDLEEINRNKLERHLQKHFIKEIDLNVRDLIDTFLHFNILQNDSLNIGFEKKEFRYFFAAKYMVKKVHSTNDFIKLKDTFFCIEKVDNVDSWLNFKAYLFGLIEPNLLLDGFENYLHKGSFLLTRKSVWLLYFALELIDKKQYPQKPYQYINEVFLTSVLKKLIHDFTIYDGRKKPDRNFLMMLLTVSLFEFIAQKSNRFVSLFSLRFIEKINYAFLTQFLRNPPFSNISKLIDAFGVFRLNIGFRDIQEMIIEINEFYKQELFKLIIPSQFGNLSDRKMDNRVYLPRLDSRFSKSESIEISYNQIVNYPATGLNNKGFYSRELLRHYVKETIASYTNDFIIYFFEKHPTPSFYLLFRVYWFIYHSGISYFKPNTSTLNNKLKNLLLIIFLSAFIDFEKIHLNFRLSTKLILEQFDDNFIDELMDKCIEVTKNDNYENYRRIKAVGTILALSRNKSLEVLSNILKDSDLTNKTIEEKDGLCYLILKAINRESLLFKFTTSNKQINNALGLFIDYLLSENPNPFLIEEILLHAQYSNETLETLVLELFEKNQYNLSLLSATISFFGRFRVEKAISKLEGLFLNNSKAIVRQVYYNLTLIKPSLYKKYFKQIENDYLLFKQIVEHNIKNKISFEKGAFLKSYVYLGDDMFLELYEILMKENLIKGEASKVSEYYHKQLKKKVARIQSIEKTSI